MSELKLIRSEIDVLSRALKWYAGDKKVCLVTVIGTWGSSPRPIGAMMAISEAGDLIGSVSGGCIEEELVCNVVNNFPKSNLFLNYSSENHNSLPCGGHVSLFVEPVFSSTKFETFLNKLKSFESVIRLINKETGDSILISKKETNEESLKENHVIAYPPPWQILMIGSGDLSVSMFKLSSLMGYRVSICDPRKEFAESWSYSSIKVHRMMPDDFIVSQNCNSETAIVALTHDPKIDDLAMLEAVKTKAFYIGALGSSRTAKAREKRLTEHFGFDDLQIKRIRAPIGIDFGTKKVDEIALSVIAEITAIKNGVAVKTKRKKSKIFEE